MGGFKAGRQPRTPWIHHYYSSFFRRWHNPNPDLSGQGETTVMTMKSTQSGDISRRHHWFLQEMTSEKQL